MPEDIKTIEDLKTYIASELAVFDTIEVLNFQIEKMLEGLEDSARLSDYHKQEIKDIHHILWASESLTKDVLKKVRAVVEDESEGNNDSK